MWKKMMATMVTACTLLLPVGFTTVASADTVNTREVEPNSSKASATALTMGVMCRGEIGSYAKYHRDGQDRDWYSFDLTAGSRYRLSVAGYNDEFASKSLIIKLFDPSGLEVDSVSYRMKRSGDDFYDFSAVDTGTYYVQMYNYFDNRTKTEHYYSIGISSQCDLKGHEFSVVNQQSATCTEEGYTGDTVCAVCGYISSEGTAIPAKGHSFSVTNKRASTCLMKGYSGDTVCTVCGYETQRGKELPKLSHKYTAWTTKKRATALKKGILTRKCTICKSTFTKTVKKLKPTIKIAKSVSVRVGKRASIKVSKLAYGDKVASWTSSNKQIVTVDAKGKIKGVKKGKAKVTVKLKSGLKRTVKVTVK